MRRFALALLVTVVAGAVLTAALVATSCSRTVEPADRYVPATGTSTPPTEQATTTVPEPEAGTFACEHALPGEALLPVHVFLLDGEQVAAAYRAVGSTTARTCALEQLLRGPTPTQKDQGLTTAIPEGTRLLSSEMDRTTAIVNLSKEFASGGGSLSMRARVAQVVYTATQFPGVKRVLINVEGKTVEALGGEGLVLVEAQTREDYEDLSPVVLIGQPGWGETLTPGESHVFEGTAKVDEGVFHLELTDGDGMIVDKQLVSVSGKTGTRGSYSTQLIMPEGAKPGWGSVIAWVGSSKGGDRVVVAELPLKVAAKP